MRINARQYISARSRIYSKQLTDILFWFWKLWHCQQQDFVKTRSLLFIWHIFQNVSLPRWRPCINILACEQQTFLLAHRRWGTFREEERLGRWARRNVCRSQAINIFALWCFKNLELCLIVVTISSFNQESLHLGVGAEAFLIKALIDSTDDKINSLVINPSLKWSLAVWGNSSGAPTPTSSQAGARRFLGISGFANQASQWSKLWSVRIFVSVSFVTSEPLPWGKYARVDAIYYCTFKQ